MTAFMKAYSLASQDYYDKAYEIGESFYDSPIYQAVLEVLNSKWFVWFNWVLGLVVIVLFFGYCLSREGRDERGRAIIGTACLYGTVVMFVLINILGYFSRTVITNLATFFNCVRMVFNGYFITVFIAIAVLRRKR